MLMNDIIPSTSLKIVSVSKLKTLPCLRKYFWRYILNLEPRQLNLNFWYGGVLGAGFESLLMKKNWRRAIVAEDKRRCFTHLRTGDLEDELRLQRRLILAFVAQAKNHPDVKKMVLKTHQNRFKVRLRDSGVLFCGTEEGTGSYRNRPMLFEIKTAKQVGKAYIDALSFDKQVHGYTYARRLLKKPVLPECCYCIFRKPQKKIKRNQTVDGFVTEIEQDLIDRPTFYYIFHKFRLGRLSVSEVGHDIERLACILKLLYDSMSEEELLDSHNWPKQENKCHDYAGCEFLQLCKRPKDWGMYLRFYKQREMLYEEEKHELKT